jgi:hypothetical protein
MQLFTPGSNQLPVAQAPAIEQRTELVSVQADRVRLAVQAGAANVHGRGILEEFLLKHISAELGDRAQPPCDGDTATHL